MLVEAIHCIYHLTVFGRRALMGLSIKEMKMQPQDIEQFQLIDSATLAAAARGELDLNHLAKLELCSRGQGLNGEWVGFKRAKEVHGV